MTSPADAKRTPDQARSPNPGVNFETYDAAHQSKIGDGWQITYKVFQLKDSLKKTNNEVAKYL